MEIFSNFGIPALAILIAGGLIWATTQVCKRAIKEKKERYLLYSALAGIVIAFLVVPTMGPWSWLKFIWTAYGGWLAANLLHKFYARYLKKLVEKNA